MRIDRLTVTLAAAVMPAAATAGIVAYDAEQKTVRVLGYPETAPARMTDLLAADTAGGWGVVTGDDATATYTVTANLDIGDPDGNGCFLQIGSATTPRETVIVNGTVRVVHVRKNVRRRDGRLAIVNRLTVGDPANPETGGILKILSPTPGANGLYLGGIENKRYVYGAELWVYNSTVTAAVEDNTHRYGIKVYPSEDVRLVNAQLAWFKGCALYGLDAKTSTVRGTTVEYGDGAFCTSGPVRAEDCTFRHLDRAIRADRFGSSGIFVRCVFAENNTNWTLGKLSTNDLVFIDCTLGSERSETRQIRKNTKVTPVQVQRGQAVMYPAGHELKTVVFKVTDREGTPVPYALVDIRCATDATAVRNGAVLTGPDGVTYNGDSADMPAITVRRTTATDIDDAPEITVYRYEVTVRKRGYTENRFTLDPQTAVPRPVPVTLTPAAR